MTATVSVVLCCYNSPLVVEQLRSIARQNLAPTEVIVVNDSTDPEMESLIDDVMTELARDHAGTLFVTIHNEANIGMYASYERAMRRASCELVATCDHDDVWMEDKLATVVPLLERSEACAVAHDVSIFYGEGDPPTVSGTARATERLTEACGWRRHARYDGRLVPLDVCLRRNRFSGTALLFRRDLLTELLPLPRDLFPDQWIVLLAAARSGLLWCDATLVHYRRHAANTVSIGSELRLSIQHLDLAFPVVSADTVQRLVGTSQQSVGSTHPTVKRAARRWQAFLGWRYAVRNNHGTRQAARAIVKDPSALLLYPSLRPVCGDVVRIARSVVVGRRSRRSSPSSS